MHLFTMNYLFHKHGLVMVYDLYAYYGFFPEDIINGEYVREGACYVCAFSAYGYQDMPQDEADAFIARCKESPTHPLYRNDYPPSIVEPVEKAEERKNRLAASWKPLSPEELMGMIYSND